MITEREDGRANLEQSPGIAPNGNNATEHTIAARVDITEHAQASAELLSDVVRHLRYGDPPENWGRLVRQIGTLMERRI